MKRLTLVALFPAIIVLAGAVFPQDALQPQTMPSLSADSSLTGTGKNDSLNTEKLKLEIEKMKREIGTIILNPFLQAGTLIAAFFTVLIALWNSTSAHKRQIRALQVQIEQNQKDRISTLLKELGSDCVAVRVATIQSLSGYPQTIPFLINMLISETDPIVQEAIHVSIEQRPHESLGYLIRTIKSLGKRQRRNALKLRALLESKEEVANRLLIPIKLFAEWEDLSLLNRIRREYSLPPITQSGHIDHGDELSSKQIIAESYHDGELTLGFCRKLVRAAERVIRIETEDEHSYDLRNAFLPEIDLSDLNLKHCSFADAFLPYSNFDGCELQDACFDRAVLQRASFSNADLRDSSFRDAAIDQAYFGKARLMRANMTGAKGVEVKFKGCKLKGARFESCELFKSNFSGAFGVSSLFDESRLFESRFSAAVLNDASFKNADLRGAKLDNIKAHRADFMSAKFGGNELRNADFSGASFEQAVIHPIKNFENAEFQSVTWTDAEFKEGCDRFREYVGQ